MKNLCIFLLAGVMLYPMGIGQSYGQGNEITAKADIVNIDEAIIVTNDYTVTITDLSDLPIIDLPISDVQFTDELLAGTSIPASGLIDFIFTTNGSGVGNDGTADTSITGSGGGTITITDATSSTGPIFHYTPVSDFVGTDTFEYTVTRGSGTSMVTLLHIVVPLPVCEIESFTNLYFGALSKNAISVNGLNYQVNNAGNMPLQPMLKGEDWKSAADVKVMDVGQTRYSTTVDTSDTPIEAYADKEPVPTDPMLLGNVLEYAGSVSAYLQLKVILDNADPNFLGGATQQMTFTTVCS